MAPRTGSITGQAPPRTKLLKEVLELQEVHTKEGGTRYTIKRLEDLFDFDKGFYVFVRALQLLKAHNDGVILVGLGGASGSGKTAFSEKIKAFMPGVVVISMDMYNDGSKVVDQNFDDPRLTDYECLQANLADLKAGRPTQVPIYDFRVSKRVGYTSVSVPEGRVVIVEGIYALSDKLRRMMDLRVSITGGVHFDLVKRVMRDIQRSGQGPEAIVQQVTETVYPMYKAFIEPDLQTAQLRITNSFNPFSGFMHPTYILKSAAVPDLELIRTQLRALGPLEEVRDRDLADIYLLPPGEDPETCVTWLRMRNKDGRYTLMFEEWVTEEPFIISPRISFEVNVKILGGLMALGYEIGAILKRTSHIFKADDTTIKVDEVDNMGSFVQLLGRERQRVADLGTALGLDGTYIARSYIEQVQLSQLTDDFASVAAEMRHKLTTSGNNTQVLSEILNASPPARPGRRIPRATLSAPMHHPGNDSLSTSAPPDAPAHGLHMAHRGPSPSQLTAALAAHNELSSTASSGAGRPPSATHQRNGNTNNTHGSFGHASSLLQSPVPAIPTPRTQHMGFSPAPNASLLTAAVSGTGAGTNGFGAAREPPHTPQPGGRSHLINARGPPRVNSLGQMLAASGSNGSGMDQIGNAGNGEGVSRAVTEQLDKQMSLITQSVEQYSDLKLQLDALVGQYQETHSALQHMSQATAQLATHMQATLAAVAARDTAAPAAEARAHQGPLGGLGLSVGVGLGAGLLAAGLVLLMVGRSRPMAA